MRYRTLQYNLYDMLVLTINCPLQKRYPNLTMDYERIHLVKPEVFVYRIPPLQTNKAARAADWKLDNPDWTGRLRLTSLGSQLHVKLEDKTTGELFAKAPIDKHPGIAVQPVSDSSRYFVVRLMDEGGRSAFIGLGFADRGDSFDFNVSLQDFFKDLERETKAESDFASGVPQNPNLDLAFKEGQTIRINLGKGDGDCAPQRRSRPSSAAGGATGGAIPFLPPPPSGVVRVSPSPGSVPAAKNVANPFVAPAPQAAGPNPFLASDANVPANANPFLTSGGVVPGAGATDFFGSHSQPEQKPASGVAIDNLLDL